VGKSNPRGGGGGKGGIEDKRYAAVQEREEHIFYLSLCH
jgi:hypothetical protein